jgi:hypothetical protein
MRNIIDSTKLWAKTEGILVPSHVAQVNLDGIATVYEHPDGILSEHPSWHLVMGANNVLTYADKGRVVGMLSHNGDEEMMSVTNEKLSRFSISAEIYGTAESNDWAIPLCANNDFRNTIGIRRSDGQIQVMGRIYGTWGNYHTFPLPAEGTVLRLEFDNGVVRAGIPATDEWYERTVPWTEAHPGIRTHTKLTGGAVLKNIQITEKEVVKRGDEEFHNSEFNGGLEGWHSVLNANLIDNLDGTVTMAGGNANAGIMSDHVPTEDKSWIAECVITEATGNCALYFSTSSGGNVRQNFSEPGTYTVENTGVITDLEVQAMGDGSARFTISKFSLKEV